MTKTKPTVDELEGRELDGAVQEKVMERCAHPRWEVESDWMDNWEATCPECGEMRAGGPRDLIPRANPTPRYSTDIAAAWEVVQHTHESLGWDWEVSTRRNGKLGSFAYVSYTAGPFQSALSTTGWVDADSIPEAICRAALKAVRRVDE